MQCPNPQCNSTAIKASVKTLVVDPGSGSLPKVFAPVGFRSPGLVILVFNLLFYSILAIFDIGWLYFLVFTSVLFGSLLVYYHSKAEKIKVYIFKCKSCKYEWSFFSPNTQDIPKAIKWYEWQLTQAQKQNKKVEIGFAFSNLSYVSSQFYGDSQRGAAFGEQSVAILRELNNKRGIGYALDNLALSMLYLGQTKMAIELFEESLSIRKEIRNWIDIAVVYNDLGHAHLIHGNLREARNLLSQALVTRQKSEDKQSISETIRYIAELAVAEEQWEKATKLFGAEEALRETDNIPIPPLDMPRYEKAVELLSQKLGEAVFIPTWREGGKMPLNEAIALALSE